MPTLKNSLRLRRTLDNIIRFTSSIGENSVFTGCFSGGENIVVRGTVRGDSDVKGSVVITEAGQWFGTLSADVVIIAGRIRGQVQARDKIEVMKSATIEGNLQAPSIAIETGAIHAGRIITGADGKVSRFEEKRHIPLRL